MVNFVTGLFHCNVLRFIHVAYSACYRICFLFKTSNSPFGFIDYAKATDCVDHNKLWKILQEMGIPDHLTWLLRNLYAAQVGTVRTRHGATNGLVPSWERST